MGKHRKKSKKKQEHEPTRTGPSTFVFRRGKVGQTVKILEENLRKVMSPYTAINLKESKKNTIKDFVNIAGPLGVTHFMILSATDVGTYMRVVKTPHGPTLTFSLLEYSLMTDIARLQSNPKSPGHEYNTPPLLVLNNFSGEENHVTLMRTTFKALFPSLDIKTKVAECKRVVLLNYDKDTETIDFRHYLISMNQLGVSKSIKRVLQRDFKDMKDLGDISEYVLGGKEATESDVEDIANPDHQVELDKEIKGKTNTTQNAIRLQEIGPRMQMKLIRVEEGLSDGSVLYHAYVKKSEAEIEALREKKEKQKKLKEIRKKDQAERIAAKKKEVRHRGQKEKPAEDDSDDGYEGGSGSDDESQEVNSDAEWYEKQVGEKPTAEDLMDMKKAPTQKDFVPFWKEKKRKRGDQEEETGSKKRKRGSQGEPSGTKPPPKKKVKFS